MKIYNRLAVIPVVAIFAIGTIFLAKSPTSPASSNEAANEQTIRQLNEQMLHAFDVADMAALDRVESDDFTLSGDFGISSKQQHLDRTRKRGPYSVAVNRKIQNQQFRFYGDVTLLTEVDRAATTGGGSSSYQSTSVWIRHGETWRVAHLHYSELTEKQ
jgi:ketosteroid isomerase-like protein